MNDKLKEYIKNCEEKFEFNLSYQKNDDEYESITRPHFKDCKNPDGSGPNKDRVPESKLSEGFAFIYAKDKSTGIICGAESFQMYTLTNQAIPVNVYNQVMDYVNKTKGTSYTDIKKFLKDYKSKLIILETHRLMSWVRGYHLAGVMIYKLENFARSFFGNREDSIIVAYETVNDYSKKAFELNDYIFTGEKKMGSKTKYTGCKIFDAKIER